MDQIQILCDCIKMHYEMKILLVDFLDAAFVYMKKSSAIPFYPCRLFYFMNILSILSNINLDLKFLYLENIHSTQEIPNEFYICILK